MHRKYLTMAIYFEQLVIIASFLGVYMAEASYLAWRKIWAMYGWCLMLIKWICDQCYFLGECRVILIWLFLNFFIYSHPSLVLIMRWFDYISWVFDTKYFESVVLVNDWWPNIQVIRFCYSFYIFSPIKRAESSALVCVKYIQHWPRRIPLHLGWVYF